MLSVGSVRLFVTRHEFTNTLQMIAPLKEITISQTAKQRHEGVMLMGLGGACCLCKLVTYFRQSHDPNRKFLVQYAHLMFRTEASVFTDSPGCHDSYCSEGNSGNILLLRDTHMVLSFAQDASWFPSGPLGELLRHVITAARNALRSQQLI